MDVLEAEEELEQEDCCCDFVQIIHDDGDRIEIHHVCPDDGFEHNFELLDCACRPTIERLEVDLHVVDHKDADLDWPLADVEEESWPPSAASTGAVPALSPPGSC
jgi:hypothetical protein